MPFRRSTRLPRQWSIHVKSGILHAISLASVAISYARGRATGERRRKAQLEQATTEIALLREELSIKDSRWERFHPKRRPHYTPIQRMRILQLRAARGWTLDKTARIFLVDENTLLGWMSRLDEPGERPLVQTVEPVDRYPDFVRGLVRQIKTLFPAMGSVRMADVLARAGLQLGATPVRRIVREKSRPTVLVDQFSRACIGFAVFHAPPTSIQVQQFLDRAIRASRHTPRYLITDRGCQFDCQSFRRWCKRQEIRLRFGVVGEPASICIVERFIRSLKQECTRRLLLMPLSHGAFRCELTAYCAWYNRSRPHEALAGKTPHEVLEDRPAPRRRFETRPRWPCRGDRIRCDKLDLVIASVEGRKHLPVIELRQTA